MVDQVQRQLGTTAGRALLTHGLNSAVPFLGTAVNAMAFRGDQPPRPVEKVAGGADTSSMQEVLRVEPVGATRASNAKNFRVIMKDGSEKIVNDLDLPWGAQSGMTIGDNYYDEKNNSLVTMPKNNENWNFNRIDPRTGRQVEGQHGLIYGGDNQGIKQYSSAPNSMPQQDLEPAQQDTSPLKSVTTVQNNYSSPISGKQIGKVDLPMLSYKPQ